MAIPLSDLIRFQRNQALRLNQRITNQELAKVFRDGAKDAAEMANEIAALSLGVGAQTRAVQLRISAQLGQDLSDKLWHETEDITRASIFRSVDMAIRQSLDIDRVTGMPLTFIKGYEDALIGSGRFTAEALIARRQFGYTLSERIYRNNLLTVGRVHRTIESGLVRRLSARELAKEVRGLIDPRTPRGPSYAAMRLARTEINNSYHFASREHMANRPWIAEVDWHLSGSHPKPDRCDDFADQSPFRSDEVPDKPHPQCLCYITPSLPDEDEFLDALLEGDYNDWLMDNSDGRIVCHSSCTVTLDDNEVYQRWDTIEEQEAFLEDNFDLVWDDFTPQQKKILESYRDNSDFYNDVLRRTKPQAKGSGLIGQKQWEAKQLQKAINMSPVNGDIIAYRGLEGEFVEAILKGGTFTDKGFVSTSLREGTARSFGDWMAEVQIPDGTRALGIPAKLDPGSWLEEQELLLNAGMTFKIISVDHIAKKLILKVVK